MGRTRVRWGRVGAIVAAASVSLAVAGGAAGAGRRDDAASMRQAAARTHVVRAGDTLWSIASSLAGPEEDPRPLVDRIIRDNGLDDGLHPGALLPGQTLVLPAT